MKAWLRCKVDVIDWFVDFQVHIIDNLVAILKCRGVENQNQYVDVHFRWELRIMSTFFEYFVKVV